MSIDNCSICLEEFNPSLNKDYQKQTCNHTFHTQCITQWFLVNNSCPICRTIINKSNLTPSDDVEADYVQWDISRIAISNMFDALYDEIFPPGVSLPDASFTNLYARWIARENANMADVIPSNGNMFISVSNRFDNIDNILDNISASITRNDNRLDNILDNISARITRNDNILDNISASIIRNDNIFADISASITSNANRIADISASITSITNRVASIFADVDSIYATDHSIYDDVD